MNDIGIDEDIIYMRKKGKQNLRLMILLFSVFLLIYSIIGYYILDVLQLYKRISFLQFYLLRTGIMLFIWIWCMIFLWRCSKRGRIVCVVYAIMNVYSFTDIPTLLSSNMTDLQHQLLRVVYIVLLSSKNLLGIVCTISLYSDTYMRSIWGKTSSHTKEVANQVERRDERVEIMQEQQVIRRTDTRLQDKAKSFLQRYAIVLIVYVSGWLIVLYVCIFFMDYYGIQNTIGMQYLQRTLVLSYLFSILIWSTSALSMFFYKRWSKWMLFFMGFVEVLRVIWLLPSYVQVFQTQRYPIIVPIILCFLEAIRYSVLLKLIRKIATNPFISAFWNKKKKLSRKEVL